MKFKESGSINYYLGINFEYNTNGILYISLSKYIIERFITSYEKLFNEKLFIKYYIPIAKNDYPELNGSDLFNTESIQKY